MDCNIFKPEIQHSARCIRRTPRYQCLGSVSGSISRREPRAAEADEWNDIPQVCQRLYGPDNIQTGIVGGVWVAVKSWISKVVPATRIVAKVRH